jgi:hypothetical protein
MKEKLCAMVVFLFSAVALFAELPPALSRLFSPDKAVALEKQGEISGTIKEDGKLSNLPGLSVAAEISEKTAAMKPTFGVELCILHKIEGQALDSEENKRKIYNALTGISSLKGILYYSESRKMMRELFYDAFRIEAPDKKEKLADLVLESAMPASATIYAFQNDSSFGENVFTVTYRYEENYFLMRMENVNLIWYGILPLVDPGNFVYNILVFPVGDYLLFYSVICVKGANPFGIMESKAASFYNRIKALDSWFMARAGL